MIISCNTIVDRRDHVQYLTVSKSYSDNCTCSLTEQNITLKKLYYGLMLNINKLLFIYFHISIFLLLNFVYKTNPRFKK